ncbi:MAG: hypothetical protein IPL39_14365 [Opitutaceae bacterium]|nr:hypothetical protein [Opitutaceae bacterium]
MRPGRPPGANAARPPPPAPLGAALGLWLGWSNPYFVFFAGCLIAGAIALHRLRRAPWARLAPLALLTATMGLALVLSHWAFIAAKLGGKTGTDQFDRGYTSAELYALKPLDLVVPPEDHRSHLLRDLGRIYASDTALKGEPFYNYLGLVGVAGLALLAFTALRRVARPRANRRVPEAALGALWAGLLATVGGGTAALALAGVDWFRASNRIGVFFSLWALFTLFGALHRATLPRPRWLALALAALLGVAGWFEQTPWFDHSAARRRSGAAIAADRATVAALEQAAGPRAMVFQLPFVPFPEAGRTGQLADYQHFRPFLASEHLRLSYGALRSPVSWEAATARLTAPELVARLQEAGFGALWLDRRGYTDEALLTQLRSLGLPEIPCARPEIVIFRLQPQAPPGSQTARTLASCHTGAPPPRIRPPASPGCSIRAVGRPPNAPLVGSGAGRAARPGWDSTGRGSHARANCGSPSAAQPTPRCRSGATAASSAPSPSRVGSAGRCGCPARSRPASRN